MTFSNQKYPNIFQGFLADVWNIKVDISQIRFKNPYSIEGYKANLENLTQLDRAGNTTGTKFRQTIRDLTVTVIDLADVTVEMQVLPQRYFMHRVHYYIDDVYTDNYGVNLPPKSDMYSTLKPVYSFNIVDFDLFKTDTRPLRTFQYLDTVTFEPLQPMLKLIGFLELTKPITNNPRLGWWIEFFKTGKANPAAPSYLKEAAKIINSHNLTQQEQAVIDAAIKERDTSQAILDYAISEGHAQGRALGHAEGAQKREREIAKVMLRDQVPITTIASYTGLTIAELEILRAQG